MGLCREWVFCRSGSFVIGKFCCPGCRGGFSRSRGFVHSGALLQGFCRGVSSVAGLICRNLGSLEGKMTKLQKDLSHVDNKVSSLKKTFEVRTTEAAKLKVELEKEQETIEAAENLVGKLEGEYQRWSEQVR